MRSFTSCQATHMDRLFWFSLLVTYLPVTESNGKENCLTQPVKIEQKTGEAAFLTCTVSENCSDKGVHYEWFVFKENSHHRLNLQRNPHKFSLDRASLRIESLNVNDSGIYHCAAVWPGMPTSGQQYVGLGTTLVVTGHIKPVLRYILLWLSFVLLAIYSLAIVTLIILKKFGCNLSICRGTYKSDKDNSTKITQFHDVLEEMYSKKKLGKEKQTAGRNIYQVEAPNTDLDSSNDDIYQNVEV